MSRHRNVRSMNYSEEYEGFDDVYGHSVEDECISPSEAGFLYDRTRYPQMSAFINEDNYIVEEEDQNNVEQKDIEKSDLSDIDMEKLRICVDEIQNVIGEMIPLNTIEEIAIGCNFSVQNALDKILNENEKKQTSAIEETSTERPRKSGNKDIGGGDGPRQSLLKFVIPRLKRVEVDRIERGVSNLNILESTGESSFSSLKKLMDQHRKEPDVHEAPVVVECDAVQTASPSTLAELSEYFLNLKNRGEPPALEDARSGFIIPKLTEKKSDSPMNWVIDLSSALKSETEIPSRELSEDSQTHNSDFLVLPGFAEDRPSLSFDGNPTDVVDVKVDLYNGKSSPFGKILCRKWKGRILVFQKPLKVFPQRLLPFQFTTPSPDDLLMKHLKRK